MTEPTDEHAVDAASDHASTAEELTVGQVELLQAVAGGQVDHLGALYFMRGRRKVSARVSKLYELGLVDPWGVAVPPDKRFPDYHRVTLTEAGRQALDTGLQTFGPVGTPEPGPVELASDAAWAARRQEDSHVDWVAFAAEMRAEGRRVCTICDQWIPVTKAGKLRQHKRQDPQRWRMVPCEGSGHEVATEATDHEGEPTR